MKRCRDSFGPITLNPDLYQEVYPHLTPETKHACSVVDKNWLRVCSRFANELSFTAPGSEDLKTVYVDLLKRYPFIQKLTIKACQNEKQIRHLVKFLNEVRDRHPLSCVKVLDVQELNWDPLEIYFELNGSFLGGLSHSDLESFTWKSKEIATRLTDGVIQPILEKTVNLKYFQIEGSFVSNGNFNLSFKNQSQLASVIFAVNRVSESTLTSLNQCKLLESMVLGGNQDPSRVIPLLGNNSWNLKHLDLTLPCNTFRLTRNMPHLESLILRQCNITIESDLEDLGRNCTKLKKLELRNLNVDEDGLARLLQRLASLELFIYRGPAQLTDGMKDVVKTNCPNLTLSHSEKSKRLNLLSFYPA